jgi:hypothetical protein
MRGLAGCTGLLLLIAGCSSTPVIPHPEPVRFDLRNDHVSSVFLYEACTLDLTITEVVDPSRTIGRPSGCGICDCAASSCPIVACGPCFEGAREVVAGGTQSWSWTPVDVTYETSGGSRCSHTRLLPPGPYRIDIPVYDLMEDAMAKVNARLVTQSFEIPAISTVVIDLAANP